MDIFRSLAPNRFLTGEIRTRNFFERLEVLSSHACAFIALRGGMGTLTEISLIWNMLQTRTMPDKPIILVGKFWKPMLRSAADYLVISQPELDIFQYADSVEDAVCRLRTCLAASRAAQ
jgi:predicted Rossmann-fold nucleotide-binding protein